MKTEKILKLLYYLSVPAIGYLVSKEAAICSLVVGTIMYYVGLKEESRKTDAIYKIAIDMQKKSSPQSGAI